ncbi:hypothetical protein ADUPG1_013599 [Aduncisulcus paluster]|uniref:Uncharacterized protein n=1 Tax=Aduncisulcus paluster TaxID=2918883 RepID=A0ABQ5K3H8_9EUKA|nr:hypothetical protein ADUPG1_013599 [Aduncisulcus paluster]
MLTSDEHEHYYLFLFSLPYALELPLSTVDEAKYRAQRQKFEKERINLVYNCVSKFHFEKFSSTVSFLPLGQTKENPHPSSLKHNVLKICLSFPFLFPYTCKPLRRVAARNHKHYFIVKADDFSNEFPKALVIGFETKQEMQLFSKWLEKEVRHSKKRSHPRDDVPGQMYIHITPSYRQQSGPKSGYQDYYPQYYPSQYPIPPRGDHSSSSEYGYHQKIQFQGPYSSHRQPPPRSAFHDGGHTFDPSSMAYMAHPQGSVLYSSLPQTLTRTSFSQPTLTSHGYQHLHQHPPSSMHPDSAESRISPSDSFGSYTPVLAQQGYGRGGATSMPAMYTSSGGPDRLHGPHMRFTPPASRYSAGSSFPLSHSFHGQLSDVSSSPSLCEASQTTTIASSTTASSSSTSTLTSSRSTERGKSVEGGRSVEGSVSPGGSYRSSSSRSTERGKSVEGGRSVEGSVSPGGSYRSSSYPYHIPDQYL